MEQLDLFSALRQPAIIRPVDPMGSVVQGDPDETLTLPHPRLAWHLARIELHRHSDGTWMWSASMCGGGYKVGPKWGRFAATRDDALHWAVEELLERQAVRWSDGLFVTPAQYASIRAWAEEMRP